MKTRNIHLKSVHLIVDGSDCTLMGSTEKGGSYHIKFSIDGSDAHCAIVKLAPIIAEQIEAQRRHHRFMRERVAGAWRTIDAAVKAAEPTP